MYFWRIERLKSKLVSAPLTDREVLPYFILFMALTTAGALLPPERANFWDYVFAAYGAAVSVLGALYLYRKNGGREGAHFLQRYFAVGWVVFVRCVVMGLPVYMVFFIVMKLPEESTPLSVAFYIVAELVFYQRLGHHIADVASLMNRSHQSFQATTSDGA